MYITKKKRVFLMSEDSKTKANPSFLESVITIVVVCIFYSLIYFVTNFPDNKDFATLAYPVVFYVAVNIIIRNCLTDIEGKRLNDLNDIALIVYVVIYLLFGNELHFLLYWLFELIGIGIGMTIIYGIGRLSKNSVWNKR